MNISRSITAFASYNKALNLPTFTDLYYQGPNNQGNPDLKPYSTQSVELGTRYAKQWFSANATVFYNQSKNTIDWLWHSNIHSSIPENIESQKIKGIELAATANLMDKGRDLFSAIWLGAGYTYLDVDKSISQDSIQKYYNLRHKFYFSSDFNIYNNIGIALNANYQLREGVYLSYDNGTYVENTFKPYWLVDIRAHYAYKWIGLYVDVKNLLNTDYVDGGSLNQPGRWYTAGLTFDIDYR